MLDDLFIDEQGRFQMASDDLATFIEFLRENEVECSLEVPNAVMAEGRSYGYGRLQHLFDVDLAMDHYRKWKSYREECSEGQASRS